MIRIRSCAVTLDSDLNGYLKQDVTENGLSVLTGFPGPRLGSAELNDAQNQGQDQARRGHRARLRFGSFVASLQRRTLPKFADAGQEFLRLLEETASLPLGQPMTAEQKMTDRELANSKRERDSVRPIKVRQMERNSSKIQPFGLQKE